MRECLKGGICSTQLAARGFFLFSHMSDELESSPEISPTAPAASAPRARKAAPRRASKAVAPAKSESVEAAAPPAEVKEVSNPPETVASDWPEPEPASSGGAPPPSEGAKRKRRRKKGKGASSNAHNAVTHQGEETPASGTKPADAPQEQGPRPNPQPQPRVKIDPELLAKFAWKIYLAEVSEEGVALISDNDAKDLSRRCFRLAEIFIEEQSRRR